MRRKIFLALAILTLAFMFIITAELPTAFADSEPCEGSENGQHHWVFFEDPPTCDWPGSRWYECTNCYMIREDLEIIPAQGHSWGDWTITRAATCTEDGVRTHTCTREGCGETETETIPALGHDWGATVTGAATCTEYGGSYHTCNRCGQSELIESIRPLGHDYQTDAKEPTCTEDGYTRLVCSRCGDIQQNEPRPALGHSWDNGQVTTAASCTADGVKTFTCTRCGATRTETIAKTAHTPVAVPAVAATCEAGGKTEGSRCSVCGTILTAQQDTALLGHAWDGGTVTTAATCTTDGVRTYTCTRCGGTRTEAIAKTGHSPVSIPAVAATCEAGGKTEGSRCSVCGTILTAQQDTAALGHSWDGGTVTTAAACTQDGVRTYTCTRCGTTRTEAIAKTGHTPVNIPAVAATCEAGGKTEGSKCSVCGTVLTAQQDTAALGHSWDGGAVTTAATCTQDGVRTYTCTRCGKTKTEAIAKTGHTPVSIPAVAATCEAGGKTEGSQCSVCGAVLKAPEKIPPLGHDFVNGVCTRCGADDPSAAPALLSGEPPFSNVDIPSGFGFLRNIPVPGDMLHIVSQPESGIIPHDSYMELTVEAAGGEGTYTYEWWYLPEMPMISSSALTAFMNSQAAGSTEAVSCVTEKVNPVASELLDAWKRKHGIQVTLSDPPANITAEEEAGRKEVFNPLAQKISDQASCQARKAGKYWCIVYDEAGHHVTSDEADMTEGVYITVQPGNMNIHNLENPTLAVEAAGGSGKYYYDWYIRSESGEDGLMNSPDNRNQEKIGIPGLGQYYVVVTDQKNEANSVPSDLVTAYSADPFDVVSYTAPVQLRQGESVELAAAFSGGVPPYSVSWYINTAPVPTEEKDGFYVMTAVSDGGEVLYRCEAVDAMGNTASCVTGYEYRTLTILKQPLGGTLGHDGGSVAIDFSWADGVAPYQVYLYRDGILVSSDEAYTHEFYTYTATEPGYYDYYIIDAQENYAYSEWAEVTDYDHVHITDYTNAYIDKPDGSGTLSVTVEGGRAPYTYDWSLKKHGSFDSSLFAKATGYGTNELTVYEPGAVYSVTVTDADGDTAYMDGLTVSYSGSVPWIMTQPEGLALPYKGRYEEYSMSLSCAAISGSGTIGLQYWWYVKDEAGNDILLRKQGGYYGSSVFSLTGPASTVCGTYKCMVVDPATGSMSVSKTATVKIPINVILNKVDETHLTLDIVGGAPPYTVTLYSKKYAPTVDLYEMVENGEYREYEYREYLLYENELPFEMKVSSSYVAHSIVGSYTVQSYTHPSTYIAYVTDSVGKTAKSYEITMYSE